MRRVIAAALLVFALAGCAAEAAPTGASPTGVSPTAPDPVDVYAVVIDRYLSGRENSFPDRAFPVVFLLDGLDPGAADPTNRGGGGTPFTPVQRERLDALVDVPLMFVPDRDAATTGDPCPVVRDGGVFLALGPATPTGADTAQVAVHGFVACQGATWFTYALRRTGTGWTVTGTTGPTAVS